MQKEIDFLVEESNQKDLEVNKLKDKLFTREEELQDIKSNLNNQLE